MVVLNNFVLPLEMSCEKLQAGLLEQVLRLATNSNDRAGMLNLCIQLNANCQKTFLTHTSRLARGSEEGSQVIPSFLRKEKNDNQKEGEIERNMVWSHLQDEAVQLLNNPKKTNPTPAR